MICPWFLTEPIRLPYSQNQTITTTMALRLSSRILLSAFTDEKELLRMPFRGSSVSSSGRNGTFLIRMEHADPCRLSFKYVQTKSRIKFPQVSSGSTADAPSRDKKTVPYSNPPSRGDVRRLYELFDRSKKLVVLTGAGISTESGIPDYRSPNGAYNTGFKPITHQEFIRSVKAQRRYWARSYAGWRRFSAAHPSAAHIALASLERAGQISYMITQNVDRLHHRAGSNPLELHGTVYTVICIECGFTLARELFQDQLKALNPKWAEAIESLEYDSRADKSFGMKQRPDGDIEIDEKFWEEEFDIPVCPKCNGLLKPNVVFFGDNVPKGRADSAMLAAKECDAFLALGSSLMTMSAFRLIRTAHEVGAATAIVNIGETRADDFVPLKINARLGEIFPRLLDFGCLVIPAV
ncbi:unnamed protein product [Cuscuta europaea]|uniref:NAD-dependent protein deacylase n=2 Tax=Cuscuta europaea TaxID=41803 RepID=A0A9P0ZQN0_CUSEU|nr:unnamed protein product [Cuscuta europaea]